MPKLNSKGDGEERGDRVNQCQVLRCGRPASIIRLVNDQLKFYGRICDQHEAMIQAGASWQPEIEDGKTIIYMGTDISPRVVDFRINQTVANLTETGPGVKLTLVAKREGELAHDIDVWLPSTTARRLGAMLIKFASKDEDVEA